MESSDLSSITAAPPTMEELWTKAAWVTNLNDPATALDRLHSTFLDVVINGPAPEDDDEEGGSRRKRRGDSDDDDEESEDLVDDFDEANDDLNDDAGNEDDLSDALGNISENEDLEEEQFSDDDEGLDEFTHWINGTGLVPPAHQTKRDERATTRRNATGEDEGSVEAELRRVGLSTRDGQIVEQPMPERLAVIAFEENRPGLVHPTSTSAASSSTMSPITAEAIWVLEQLTHHCRPFHNNTYVQSVISLTTQEQRDHLLVRTVAKALEFVLEDKLEPAYLMMYRQRALLPLLAAKWSDIESQKLRDISAVEERQSPNVDYAYCLETGRRQIPLVKVKEGEVFHHDGKTANIGSGDTKWTSDPIKGSEEEARDERRPNNARVKPCFLELGRILVAIVDLDIVYGRLERSRSVTLERLRAAGPIADAQFSFLRKSGPYRDATDADAWASFATFVTAIVSADQRLGGRSHNATAHTASTKKLQRLGLEEAFETFALTGLQFQENLQSDQAIHTLPTERREKVHAFARAAGLAVQSDRELSGPEVLELFAKVMAEQYSQLPSLRRRVVQAFLRDGLVVVTYVRAIPGRGVSGQHRSISIASLLESSPRDFLDLLQDQRHGMIKVRLHLDFHLVLSASELDTLGGGVFRDEEWANERALAFDMVAKKLIHTTRGYVKTILEQIAFLAVAKSCSEKLSHSCAEGPYEPTQLALEAYDPARRTWESEWNIVEALPSYETALHSTLSPPSRRVCGAFRGMNGVTCFTFLDASGNVLGHARWVDVDMKTVEGRMRNAQQHQSLRQLLRKHFPSVIGVAAVAEAQRLVQTLERLMFEELHKDLGVHIPVVWVSPMSAIVAANSSYMLRAAQNADSVTRCSTCTARYLQDPLHQVCSMFDDQNSILKLPIGVHRQVNSRKLVAALQWEVSLWVAACGVELDDVSRVPHANTVVQFVPGFGPRKAARLCEALRALPVPPTSRLELQELLTSLFGREVERNALSTFRVAAPVLDDDSNDNNTDVAAYHPLDSTLIPREFYNDAEYLVWRALNNTIREYDEGHHQRYDEAPADHATGALAASLFMSLSEEERRSRLAETVPFNRRVDDEFIKSELISGHRSYMRRPYRTMINKLLFKLQTGVLFLTRSDMEYTCPAEARASLQGNPLIVCEGSIEQGTVAGVRGGTIEGIRVNTTKGVPAFISADDIDVEIMRDELRDWNRYTEDDRLARDRGEPRPPTRECPEWLRRGSLIHGTVSNCNYERGELRLRWCEAALETADEGHHAAQVDDALGARSVNSVMTAQIIDAARVNMLKISRHDLFKSIDGKRAAELLAGKCIGESLIRQSKHGKSNEALICVKVGSRSIANWPVREVRIHTGQVVYELRDERSQRNHRFHDVDHVLDSYIKRAVERVHSIRQHRKFITDSRDVSRRLTEDQRSGKFRLVYYFAEVEDEERPQTFYKLFYRLMNEKHDRSMKLHIDCENVFVRLPKGRGAYEWTPCASAEEAATLLKGYAANMMRGEKESHSSRRGGRRSEL